MFRKHPCSCTPGSASPPITMTLLPPQIVGLYFKSSRTHQPFSLLPPQSFICFSLQQSNMFFLPSSKKRKFLNNKYLDPTASFNDGPVSLLPSSAKSESYSIPLLSFSLEQTAITLFFQILPCNIFQVPCDLSFVKSSHQFSVLT